jgi:PIN domain nuclease of toxin-antitoxin system
MAAAGREERAPVGEVSAIELATKRRLGRLPRADAITLDVEPAIVGNGFRAPPISMAHAALAGRLGIPHKGPSDRLLIAQSLIENAPPVSKETLFDAAGVTRPW